MAKNKVKVPKRIGGIKLKKRHRKQLRALVDHIDRIEELMAAGTALLAVLGLGHKLGKQDKGGDKADSSPMLAH